MRAGSDACAAQRSTAQRSAAALCLLPFVSCLTPPLPLRRYKVVHWDPPHKVTVTGDSGTVAAVDSIQFYDAENGHTKIEYDVRWRALRVAAPAACC